MKKWPRQATEENETKKKLRLIKSLLLDNFSLRSQQMVPNYFLYPYKYPEFHLRKIWPQFWANRHFPDDDGHYGGLHTNWQIKALLMTVIGKVCRELRFYCYLYSLTQTDSIIAYTSLGSKLQQCLKSLPDKS